MCFGATGSRLPLPTLYPLLEISYPQQNQTSNKKRANTSCHGRLKVIQEEGVQEQELPASKATERHPGVFAVACALLLELGCQETGQLPCLAGTSGKFLYDSIFSAPDFATKQPSMLL